MTMRKMALMMDKGMAKTLPGLRNFYMIGQWVEPSGNIQLSAGSGPVTQTLFSASMIAEVLPRIWQRNQALGQQKLEELRELTRGALAEMRTLFIELRPTKLMEIELADLLRQLADGIIGRAWLLR